MKPQIPGGSPGSPSKNSRRKGSDKSLLAIVALFAIVLLLVLEYGRHRTSYPAFYAAQSPFVDPEHAHPAAYLTANGSFNAGNWGNRDWISGAIANNARHTSYRDIHIKVNFLNQTNSIVSVQEYILDKSVPYGSKVSFRLKVRRPLAAVACGWMAVGGSYY